MEKENEVIKEAGGGTVLRVINENQDYRVFTGGNEIDKSTFPRQMLVPDGREFYPPHWAFVSFTEYIEAWMGAYVMFNVTVDHENKKILLRGITALSLW